MKPIKSKLIYHTGNLEATKKGSQLKIIGDDTLVVLSQKVLMIFSYPQTHEPFIFLKLKFLAAITNQGQQFS